MVHSGKAKLARPALSAAVAASNVPAKVTPEEARKIAEQYGRIPMSFEPNQGQSASEVKFLSRGPGYDLYLTSQEAVLAMRRTTLKNERAASGSLAAMNRPAAARSESVSVVRMKLDGAKQDAEVSGLAPLPGKVNYLIGNDPAKWHTDIRTFASVKYSDVYPGIDLVYYGNQKQLEYDFVVAPGADPKAIAFNVDGARALRIEKNGDLALKTASGDVKFQKPFVYQEDSGKRHEIAGNYVVEGKNEVRFALGDYDRSKALTIDPSVLIYSTYLGGSGAQGDFALGIAIDGQGDAWVAGNTTSTDFPSANALTPVPPELAGGFTAAFVTEVNPGGTSFLYSTYLGGSGNGGGGDGAQSVAVDTNGNVFVTGYTESADFPTTSNAYQGSSAVPGSVAGSGSAFVTALHPATAGNSQLTYSSFLGGSGTLAALEQGNSIVTDGNGNVFVAGITNSTDFPTLNPIVSTANSADGNAFVTEINTAATTGPASLVFSTYLGGSGAGGTPSRIPFGNVAFGVALDSSGAVYAVGTTTSTDFAPAPTGGTPCGDNGYATAFLVKINVSVTPPTSAFSSCFGGAVDDTSATSIAIAPDKTAVIAGQTFTTDITPTNVIPTPPGVPNPTDSLVFVVKYNTTGGTAIAYSTLFGGSAGDNGYSVATDSSGDIYVGGETNSGDFPVTQGALQVAKNNPDGTAFVAKLNPAGGGASDLLYASYFGGAGQGMGIPDAANAIAAFSGNAYIAGQTSSANSGATPFPITPSAPLTALGNTTANAFVAELPLTPTVTIAPTTLNFGSQPVGFATAPLYATVTNNTATSVGLTIPPTFTGANAADFAYSATGTSPCGSSLASGSTCVVGVTFTPSVQAAESATLNLVDSDDTAAHPLLVTLSGTGTATGAVIGISPTSLAFGGELIGASSAAQPVTITNNGNSALTITQIQSTSANFTETDSCTAGSIAPAGTCTINVTFAPPTGAAPGPSSGNITLTDNANGSPQAIAVSGTVWDFNLTVPATASVNKGSTSPFTVGINGLGGFTGNVTVGCSSAASNIASCAVSPSSGVPGGSVTVTVTSTGMLAPIGSPTGTPPFAIRQVIFAAIAMMLLFLIPMTRRTRTRLGLAAAMMVFAVVAGCSGSPKTKTTTLTITGSSGSVTKTYTVNLTVTG
jgi:hypothetical protein